MNFIFRWLRNKIRDSEHSIMHEVVPSSGTSISKGPSSFLGGLQFSVHQADGGMVVEFNKYDPKTDRRIERLYLIKDGEDIGSRLANIITIESLR